MTSTREEPKAAAAPSRRKIAEFRSVAITGLFVLAVFYTLHLARDFILPIVLAIFLALMLQPLVRLLRRLRVPQALAPILVMSALVLGSGVTVWRLWDPVAERVAEAPRDLRRIERRLQQLLRPVESMARTAQQVDELADGGTTEAPTVEIRERSFSDVVVGGAWELLAGGFVVLVLTYFFLATGDRFVRKLPRVLARQEAEQVVTIMQETEAQLSRYLITITLINIGLGLVTGLAMMALGMPAPILLGILGGMLNFVPYFGTAVATLIYFMVAIITFVEPSQALAPPLVFLLINTIETNFVTPHLLGRRLPLNPLVIFLGFLFWWWIWGVPGAILAVPILATIKIVSDRTETMAGVGEFLGR